MAGSVQQVFDAPFSVKTKVFEAAFFSDTVWMWGSAQGAPRVHRDPLRDLGGRFASREERFPSLDQA